MTWPEIKSSVQWPRQRYREDRSALKVSPLDWLQSQREHHGIISSKRTDISTVERTSPLEIPMDFRRICQGLDTLVSFPSGVEPSQWIGDIYMCEWQDTVKEDVQVKPKQIFFFFWRKMILVFSDWDKNIVYAIWEIIAWKQMAGEKVETQTEPFYWMGS